MGDDAIIPYSDQFTHKGMGLDFAPIPDDDIFLDFNKRTDKTVIPYFTPVNIDRLNDSDILPEFHIADLDILQDWLYSYDPQLAFLRLKAKGDLVSRFDRLINGADELQGFSSFKSIDQSGFVAVDGANDVFKIFSMVVTQARGVFPIFLKNRIIFGLFGLQTPRSIIHS